MKNEEAPDETIMAALVALSKFVSFLESQPTTSQLTALYSMREYVDARIKSLSQ